MLDQYPHEFLTVKEVAKELNSDVHTVREIIHNGSLPAKQIGRRWYIAKDWLCQPSNQGKDYA